MSLCGTCSRVLVPNVPCACGFGALPLLDPRRPLSVLDNSQLRGTYTVLEPNVAPVQLLVSLARSTIGEMIALNIQALELEKIRAPVPLPYTTLLRADVKWGTGGVYFVATMDVLRGVQIAVPAETIEVTGYQRDVKPPWVKNVCHPCLPKFAMHAGVAYGCVGRQAQLTDVVFAEAPTPDVPNPQATLANGCRFVDVPGFAQRVTLQIIGTGTARLRIFGYGEGFLTEYRYTSGAGPDEFGVGQQIPLPNGARFVDVISESGSRLIAYVIFQLAL